MRTGMRRRKGSACHNGTDRASGRTLSAHPRLTRPRGQARPGSQSSPRSLSRPRIRAALRAKSARPIHPDIRTVATATRRGRFRLEVNRDGEDAAVLNIADAVFHVAREDHAQWVIADGVEKGLGGKVVGQGVDIQQFGLGRYDGGEKGDGAGRGRRRGDRTSAVSGWGPAAVAVRDRAGVETGKSGSSGDQDCANVGDVDPGQQNLIAKAAAMQDHASVCGSKAVGGPPA